MIVGMAATADQDLTATSPSDRLADWELRTRPLIIAAAVLPLFGVFMKGPADAVVWIVAVGTWVVFLIDLLVHMRLAPGYLRTRTGVFDLVLVISTFPWYLVLGSDTAGVTQVLRLARLERIGKVVFSAPTVKRFASRLGRPVIYAAVMWFACSLIVTRAEGPENGFVNLGTGLWWGIVTLTTVGYGDLVPETTVGRVTASVLMVAGVALLGTVAASLASLFRMQDQEDPDVPTGPTAEDLAAAEAATGVVGADEVAALRRQLDDLGAELRTVRTLLEARSGDET